MVMGMVVDEELDKVVNKEVDEETTRVAKLMMCQYKRLFVHPRRNMHV